MKRRNISLSLSLVRGDFSFSGRLMPPNNPSARIRERPELNIFLRRGSRFICADPRRTSGRRRTRRRLAYPARGFERQRWRPFVISLSRFRLKVQITKVTSSTHASRWVFREAFPTCVAIFFFFFYKHVQQFCIRSRIFGLFVARCVSDVTRCRREQIWAWYLIELTES